MLEIIKESGVLHMAHTWPVSCTVVFDRLWLRGRGEVAHVDGCADRGGDLERLGAAESGVRAMLSRTHSQARIQPQPRPGCKKKRMGTAPCGALNRGAGGVFNINGFYRRAQRIFLTPRVRLV